jgi:glycosyltransferase involved in cell wall biosynthesis
VSRKKTDLIKVAIIGSRGYPYVYGGYETFVKELSERLITKDVEVHVYNQKNLFTDRPAIVNGIHIHYIPTIAHKSLNQIIYCFLSLFHAAFSSADVIFVLNLAAGPMGWIPKITGKKTIINTDGLEWMRPKWKGLGSKYFYFGAWSATKLYDQLICDADAMQKVYLEKFNAQSRVIAYGAPPFKISPKEHLSKFGLTAGEYYLIVGRLVPDNNADLIVKGFLLSKSTKKIVIVGDVPYRDTYAQDIKALANEKVIFLGYVKDPDVLMSLYQHCYIYLHGHQFGGTNPAMLKAMSNQCAILALDTPFNQEMLDEGEFGMFFKFDSAAIAKEMDLIEEDEAKVIMFRGKVKYGLTEKYNWDVIADKYKSEFIKLIQ